jgi:prepilin-type N-terminal cleavage/methylation domain-containing protein
MRNPLNIISPSKLGFSLVELSIVLVVLGLLVGGILAGKSLIRASELRAVVREYELYRGAVFSFREKYLAIPGDMANASQFWGLAAAGLACRDVESVDKTTCNGNGDGRISPRSFLIYSDERMRFWQHLANAEMISGQYDGVNIFGRSKLSTSAWLLSYSGILTGNSNVFDGFYGNYFQVFDGNIGSQTGVMSAAETWNIDTKIDDGKPARGKVVSMYYPANTDATLSSQLDANYLLTDSPRNSGFIFREQF